MGKDEDRKFPKQEAWMAINDAYEKMLNLVIKAVKQNKKAEPFPVIRSGKKLKHLTTSSVGKNERKLKILYVPGGSENCQPSLKCNLSISSKVKSEAWIT